jgi:Beta/Gamma crystallin
MTMKPWIRVSPALAILLCSTLVSSQERQLGGIGLTVYTDYRFRGRSATFRDDIPNLESVGLNDRVSSLQVARGERWEVCEHANYAGRCVVVSGSESDLRQGGWNDIISSARRVSGGGGGVGPPVQPGMRGLELYSAVGFSGSRRVFTDEVSNLQSVGFNDAAMSLRVGRGESWQVCVHEGYRDCRVVNTDWSDLTTLGLRRRISSLRPVRGGGAGQRLVLYDDRNYRGQSWTVDREMSGLAGFSNRAESAKVSGGSWELCARPGFGGQCVTISGNVADLGPLGLLNRVNSVRPRPMPR